MDPSKGGSAARPAPAGARPALAVSAPAGRARGAQDTGGWFRKACSGARLEAGTHRGRPGPRAAGDPEVVPGPEFSGHTGCSSTLGNAEGSRARRAASIPQTQAPERPPRAGTRAPALGAGLSADSAPEVPMRQGFARPRARDLSADSPGQPQSHRRSGRIRPASLVRFQRIGRSLGSCPHPRPRRTRWDPPNPCSLLRGQVDTGVSFISDACTSV